MRKRMIRKTKAMIEGRKKMSTIEMKGGTIKVKIKGRERKGSWDQLVREML